MSRIMRCIAGVVAFAFLFSAAAPRIAFADEAMDRKCKATKEGTETNEEVKKECLAYFEQEKARGAAAAGAEGGAAAAAGVTEGTIALSAAIIAAIVLAIALASGGNGGGDGGGAAHHH